MATPPKVDIVNAPDCRSDYANSTMCTFTFWDFCLTFGSFEASLPDKLTITNFQKMQLSPTQAKALLGVLGSVVANYEKAFGAIATLPGPAATDPYLGSTAAVQ
jgi:hypothetical protein